MSDDNFDTPPGYVGGNPPAAFSQASQTMPVSQTEHASQIVPASFGSQTQSRQGFATSVTASFYAEAITQQFRRTLNEAAANLFEDNVWDRLQPVYPLLNELDAIHFGVADDTSPARVNAIFVNIAATVDPIFSHRSSQTDLMSGYRNALNQLILRFGIEPPEIYAAVPAELGRRLPDTLPYESRFDTPCSQEVYSSQGSDSAPSLRLLLDTPFSR